MRFLFNIIQFAVIIKFCNLLMNILPDTFLYFYASIAQLFLLGHIATWMIEFTGDYLHTSTIDPKNKAVLITGCDSGFGNALAKRLDKKGFKIFACCLDPNSPGANYLKETCSSTLEIIELNVIQDQSVYNALSTVKNNLKEFDLWAVVNNAGVLKGFAFELTRMKDIEDVIQINALGPVRITKAFLPLLRKSRGRVINVNSRAGRISNIYFGPYDMSKYASVAFTEVLMQEAREFGIRVISIEPDVFKTQLSSKEYLNKVFDSAFQDMDEEVKAAYGDIYIEQAANVYKTLSMYSPGKIEVVLDALEKAISLQYPADVYRPCRNTFTTFLFFLAERVPRILKDFFIMGILYMKGIPKPRTGVNFIRKISIM